MSATVIGDRIHDYTQSFQYEQNNHTILILFSDFVYNLLEGSYRAEFISDASSIFWFELTKDIKDYWIRI